MASDLEEKPECRNMVNKFYQVTPSGAARAWNTYIYVVARNYLPRASKELAKAVENGGGDVVNSYLCTDDSDSLQFGSKASAGVSATGTPKSFNDTDRTKDNDNKYGQKSSDHYRANQERKLLADMYKINPEDEQHACVIYVQKGDTFNYRNFQTTMIERFEELLREQDANESEATIAAQARKAFTQLDLMFIGSVSTKDTLSRRSWPVWLGGRSGHYVGLPMMYWRFYDAYIRHKGTKTASEKDGGKDNVDNRDYRVEYVDFVKGKTCYFNDTVSISCDDSEDEMPRATVTFKRGYKGRDIEAGQAKDVEVVAQYLPLNTSQGEGIEQRFYPKMFLPGKTFDYVFEKILTEHKTDEGTKVSSIGKEEVRGTVRWTVKRSGNAVDMVECQYNMAGNTPSVSVQRKGNPPTPPSPTPSPAPNPNPNPDPGVDPNSKQDPRVNPNPNPGVNPNPNSDLQDPNGKSRLAQLLSQIPQGAQDRGVFGPNTNGGLEKLFEGRTKLLRGSDTQHCATQDPIAMDSAAAMKFVNDVIKAYNAANPNAPILPKVTYGNVGANGEAEGFPTDGEFMDAVNIAHRMSGVKGMPKTVPAAAVCELGRDMVRMSVDPHAKNVSFKGRYSSPYDSTMGKAYDNVFHNDLGAFLVYIGQQAMLYPAKYTVATGECDMRFMSADSFPCKQLDGLPGHFHYNNYGTYTPIAAGTWASPSGFATSLAAAGLGDLNSNPPLKGLASSAMTSLDYKDCGKAGHNCAAKGDKYKKAIAYLLGEPEDFEPWQGQACMAFYGGSNGPDIEVKDVWRYVTTACEKGLDVKPHGVGSAEPNGGAKRDVHGRSNDYTSPTTPKDNIQR